MKIVISETGARRELLVPLGMTENEWNEFINNHCPGEEKCAGQKVISLEDYFALLEYGMATTKAAKQFKNVEEVL